MTAGDGMTVLATRGFESESELAFASLTELLRPLEQDLGALRDVQREALAAALAIGPPVDAEPLTVCVAALDLVAVAAEREPLLIVIDDAHWLDRPTAEVVSFLTRRLHAERVAVLVAMRPAAGAFDSGGLAVIELDGLEPDAAAELAGAAAPVNAAVAAQPGRPHRRQPAGAGRADWLPDRCPAGRRRAPGRAGTGQRLGAARVRPAAGTAARPRPPRAPDRRGRRQRRDGARGSCARCRAARGVCPGTGRAGRPDRAYPRPRRLPPPAGGIRRLPPGRRTGCALGARRPGRGARGGGPRGRTGLAHGAGSGGAGCISGRSDGRRGPLG